MTRFAFLLFLLATAPAIAEAQTPAACPPIPSDELVVVAPSAPTPVCFVSAVHDERDIDNSFIVAGYDVLYFRDGDNTATGTPIRPALRLTRAQVTTAAENVVRLVIPTDYTPGQRFRLVMQPFGTIAGTGTPRPFPRSAASHPFGLARTGPGSATGAPRVGPLP